MEQHKLTLRLPAFVPVPQRATSEEEESAPLDAYVGLLQQVTPQVVRAMRGMVTEGLPHHPNSWDLDSPVNARDTMVDSLGFFGSQLQHLDQAAVFEHGKYEVMDVVMDFAVYVVWAWAQPENQQEEIPRLSILIKDDTFDGFGGRGAFTDDTRARIYDVQLRTAGRDPFATREETGEPGSAAMSDGFRDEAFDRLCRMILLALPAIEVAVREICAHGALSAERIEEIVREHVV